MPSRFMISAIAAPTFIFIQSPTKYRATLSRVRLSEQLVLKFLREALFAMPTGLPRLASGQRYGPPQTDRSNATSGARLAFTGPYPTTFSGNTDAMVVSHTTFSGGVTNAGTIGAGGISVSSSTFLSGGIVDTGVISGGIRIDSHSRIVASGTTAVALENTTTFGGGISNAGTISGACTASLSPRFPPSRLSRACTSARAIFSAAPKQ